MITLLNSIGILPSTFNSSAKYDSSHFLAGGEFVPPGSGSSLTYMYGWNGSSFSLLASGGGAGGELPSKMKVQGNYIYRMGNGWTTASGAAVGQWEWNGSTFVNTTTLYYYPGMIGMDPYEYRGWVYGFDGDGTYMYVCGRTWTVVSFPPYVLKYVYSLDALQSTPGSSILKKSLSITTEAECGNVICCAGFIYLFGSSIKRYTFSGTDFTLKQTHTLVNVTATDGTYLFGKSGNNLIAYNSLLSALTSFDTGSTISDVQYADGYVYVTHPTNTEIYLFTGSAFSLITSADYNVSNICALTSIDPVLFFGTYGGELGAFGESSSPESPIIAKNQFFGQLHGQLHGQE